MNIPPKGSMLRAHAELAVQLRRSARAFRAELRPLMRWMSRQSWVAAYAEWDERHVPKWFTFWNIAYAGIVLWGIVLTARWVAS